MLNHICPSILFPFLFFCVACNIFCSNIFFFFCEFPIGVFHTHSSATAEYAKFFSEPFNDSACQGMAILFFCSATPITHMGNPFVCVRVCDICWGLGVSEGERSGWVACLRALQLCCFKPHEAAVCLSVCLPLWLSSCCLCVCQAPS